MAKRSLRPRLDARDLMCGVMVGFPSPSLVELVAAAEFDFVVIDTEHGAIGVEAMEHLPRSAHAFGLPGLVRVAANERAPI